MQYREDKISGNKLSILGFGCMRFPRDKAETERMILAAIEGGVNYFDTAYIYPGSEKTLGAILAKHGKRKDVYIATKLPLMMCKEAGDLDKFFAEHLKRLQTDYIDYYLLHSLSNFAQWETFRELGIENWLAKKKAAGQIRRIGFSYHGSRDDFLKILGDYDWEFCQLQYNYSDENYQAGKDGLKAAAAKNLPVIIMEPLLGGKLATGLPKKAAQVFAAADPSLTPADRGLRWLWNQDEVTTVLSGMSSLRQTEENIRAANGARPLTDEDLAVYAEAVKIFKEYYKIHCTGCNYCMPCPKGINIPSVFAAYNASYLQGFRTGMQQFMMSTGAVTKNPHSPRLCVSCGNCEKHCPQALPIRESLKKVSSRFEPLPLRLALALARRVISSVRPRES